MSPFSQSGSASSNGQESKIIPAEPSDLLVRFSGLLPTSGRALDIACGAARNSLFLSRRGLSVVGVDLSRQALVAGREAATRLNLNTHFVQADLTRFVLPADTFSVVLCVKYRDLSLYPSIRAALRPGGLLIYETYTAERRGLRHKPWNPAHLLGRNELLQAFCNWEIIFYHEVWMERGMASMVARKPFSADES